MTNLNINEIQNLDFNNTDQPYIVKKYAKDWFAFNNWSFNFLKKLDQNLLVNTVVGNAASGNTQMISIKFEEYIDKIINTKTNAFLSTFHLFKKFPKLKKHINYNNIKNKSLIYHLLGWIGPAGTITGFHCDWSENINVQIKGKKIFYLVNPKYNKYMYISDRFERISWTSSIELKNLDHNKFPLFKNVKLIKVVLDEGDAIYIPRGWWHYVESIEPSINVSIHYWRTVNFFRDLLIELLKVFLHDIGLYKKNNCSCHTKNTEGKRVKRG